MDNRKQPGRQPVEHIPRFDPTKVKSISARGDVTIGEGHTSAPERGGRRQSIESDGQLPHLQDLSRSVGEILQPLTSSGSGNEILDPNKTPDASATPKVRPGSNPPPRPKELADLIEHAIRKRKEAKEQEEDEAILSQISRAKKTDHLSPDIANTHRQISPKLLRQYRKREGEKRKTKRPKLVATRKS